MLQIGYAQGVIVMSNDPVQPTVPPEEAGAEEQSSPMIDETGSEETPLSEEIAAVDEAVTEVETVEEAVTEPAAEEEATVPAVEEIQEAVAAVEHPHKKHSFFDRLFGHKEEETQPQAAAAEQPAVAEAAAAETPAETQPEGEAAPAAAALGLEDVKTVVREEVGRAQSEILAAIPTVNLEDVKITVLEEISRAQGDIQNTIQMEVARLENDSARREYEAAQDTMADFYRSKSDMIAAKVELLKQRQAVVFNDTSRPIKEVKEDVGIISEMLSEAQRDMAEVESVVTSRAAVTSELVASLGAREQIAALQRQLEEQKSQVAVLDEKVKSRTGGAVTGKAGLNWWQLLGLALLLIVGIGASTLYLKNSVVNQKPAALLVETAALYQGSGDTEEAVRVLDEAVATGIKDPQVLGRIGEMYRLAKQFDKAVDALNKALAKDPNNETTLLSLARTYSNQGKNAEAITVYQKLTGLDTANTTYLTEMAGRYRANKNYDEAFAQLDKVLAIKPAYYQAYITKGDIFREQQKWDEAIAQYKKAIEITPTFTTYLNMGISYAGKRDYNSAITQYSLASDMLPDRAESYYYSAEARVSQARMDEAISLYQQAIAVNEKYVLAYIGLGKVYTLKNDCTSAVPYFQQALKYSAKNEEAIQGLSNCASKTK